MITSSDRLAAEQTADELDQAVCRSNEQAQNKVNLAAVQEPPQTVAELDQRHIEFLEAKMNQEGMAMRAALYLLAANRPEQARNVLEKAI